MISIGDAMLKLGVDKGNFDRDMKGIGASIKKHQKAIGIGMMAVGTAIVGMATASVVSFAKVGDEVAKMAKRTGFSTEALSELRHAAELSGASLQGLEKASRTLAGAILDAGYGLESYTRAFDMIGVNYTELAKLKPEQQFIAVMEALAKVEDETVRAAIATDLFGRAGTQLLPMLADGAEGLAEMRAEAHELGIVFDVEAAKSAEDFTDAMTRVKASLQGAMFAIADSLIPAIQPLIDQVTEVVKKFGAWAKENEGLTKIIVGAGGLLIGLGGLLLILPKLNAAFIIIGHTLKTLLLNPIVLLIAALAMLGYGIYALIDRGKQYDDMIVASTRFNKEFEKSQGEVTEELIEAARAYADLREAYGYLEPEEEKQIENLKNLVQLWDEGYYAMGAYGEGLDETTGATVELKAATDALSDSLRESVATAFMAYAALSGKRVLTPFEFEQQKLLGQRLGIPGLQAGGIITSPTLAMLGEKGPEAVVPLDRMGGFKTANIYVQVDGRTLASVIGQPLIDEIRLRTGAKL